MARLGAQPRAAVVGTCPVRGYDGDRVRRRVDDTIMGSVVAVADLRVEDAVLTQAEAGMRAGAHRLGPVSQALQNLDAEVVGAESLSEALHAAHGLLAVAAGVVGQALAELAQHTRDSGTTFANQDAAWAQGIRQGAP